MDPSGTDSGAPESGIAQRPWTRLMQSLGAVASMRQLPSRREARGRYLDLLEKALLHTLYLPPDQIEMPEFSRSAFAATMKIDPEAEPSGPPNPIHTRAQGRDWPLYAHSMIGVRRLRNLRRCVQQVLADRVPGDLIEAGTWRGGAAILMRGVLAANGTRDRCVWAADSFSGVPKPNPQRYPADAADLNYTAPELAVSRQEVEDNFRRYDLLDEQVRFLEGLFAETLPTVSDRTWAVVRLDGDLYESTMDGLTNLYPGLSIGGFMIIDDYGWDNCRQAVEDYREEHAIEEPIERIDWVGAYWRRSA
jgi:O-methyltransferase